MEYLPNDIKGEIVKYFTVEEMPLQKLLWGPLEPQIEPLWIIEVAGDIATTQVIKMMCYHTNCYSDCGNLVDMQYKSVEMLSRLRNLDEFPVYTEREPTKLCMDTLIDDLVRVTLFAVIKKEKICYDDIFMVDNLYIGNNIGVYGGIYNSKGDFNRVLFKITCKMHKTKIEIEPLIKRY